MRLRKIKGADEAIASSPYVVHENAVSSDYWKTLFGNGNPVHIEIGMGKGRFLMQLAAANPQINYIGIERYTSVLIKAVKKIEEEPLSNLRFLCIDAANLEQFFVPRSVERIYLNFSDPWPKERHARRRLTSPQYLKRYKAILAPEGQLEFKTDNPALFDFSLESIEASHWKLTGCSRDLHNDSEMNSENIMTEYEEKFAAQGNPIYKLIAIP